MVPTLFLVFLYIMVCNAQFPKECVNRDSLMKRECCPIGEDGSQCNSAKLKGFCVTHTQFQYYHPGNEGNFSKIVEMDDRGHWPSRFFDRICMCQGHFFGPNCGKCDYGYEGENCNILKTPKKRKNALSLTKEERDQLREALILAKKEIDPDYVIVTKLANEFFTDLERTISQGEDSDEVKRILNESFRSQSYWDTISWLHYYTAKRTVDQLNITGKATVDPKLYPVVNFGHMGASFAPWHRYFLLLVEERLQKVSNNSNLTLPYWDWTQDYGTNNCSVCTDDLVGALDDSSPLHVPHKGWARLSKNSPLREWKAVCGFTEDYKKNGTLCQGNTTEDDYLTRAKVPGKVWQKGDIPFYHVRLPNAAEVKALLKIVDYDRIDRIDGTFQSFNHRTTNSFRNSLEGFMGSIDPEEKGRFMHNVVHMWSGGAMTDTPIAANDPLFFLHHCNIDRIFETWLQKHADTAKYGCIRFGVEDDSDEPEGCPIGHDIREFMAPFFPLKTPFHVFRPSKQFGYQYDQLAGGRITVLSCFTHCFSCSCRPP